MWEDGRSIRGRWGCWQSLAQNALVQGFLFYPDGCVHGETSPVLTTQHILAKLGRVHAASAWCCHAETFLEKTLQNLDGVEPAVAIEGKADDVCWVLVPASIDRVTHNVSSLRKDLLNEDLLSAQGDPLAQVRCDTNHKAVTGLCHPSLLALLLPALELLDHGCQLVITRLFVQQVEVLEVIWKEQFAGPEETENVAEYLAIPIYEVVLLQAVQHDGLGAIEQTTDSWIWVLGEGCQAASVHVSPDIDVHRGVRLGQLSRQRDPLSGQRRDRGPGQRQPWHASSLLEHRWDDLLPLLCSYLDTRKMCALIGILLRISASCLPFCLNETAPVVCYEKKKANNPSLNNRAELKKKNLAPGCPSASGPGIRLQLAQLHSLTQAIFSRKKTWYPLFPKLWLHRYNNLSYFFRQKVVVISRG